MKVSVHDQPTVVRSREAIMGQSRPPTPFASERPTLDAELAWLATLPPEARAVLEAARRPAPRWPLASRVRGAIAEPVRKGRALSSRPGTVPAPR